MQEIKLRNKHVFYDYMALFAVYGVPYVYLFYIPVRSCRDRRKIKTIISNAKSCNDIDEKLKSIGYVLIFKENVNNDNIMLYYITRDNELSIRRYSMSDFNTIEKNDFTGLD